MGAHLLRLRLARDALCGRVVRRGPRARHRECHRRTRGRRGDAAIAIGDACDFLRHLCQRRAARDIDGLINILIVPRGVCRQDIPPVARDGETRIVKIVRNIRIGICLR